MKKILIIFALVGITTFISCEKIANTTWVYYDETWCFDKWGNSNVPENEKKKNIKAYLESKGIKVLKVQITDNRAEYEVLCKACNCIDGYKIQCKIKESDLGKAINENFYQ